MKKMGWMFILIWGLGSWPAQQFFRLPELINHFDEHQVKNSSLTFSQFLYMHYVISDGDKSDDAKEQSLPFKGGKTIQTELDVFVEAWSTISLQLIHLSDFLKSQFHYQIADCTDCLAGVFRPPLGV
jgi:hypothetical protein